MVSVTTADTPPLFIIGAMRSGTTLVRDLLRRQTNVICPEETHYYRFGEPFRAPGHRNAILGNATLKKHREIDGISQPDFERMVRRSRNRAELMRAHVAYMAEARGLTEYRWFDKSPQNVYGLPLLRAEFPDARFLHLVRNPLNVVASLKLGKVVKIQDLHAACNCWIEAVQIIHSCAPQLGEDLLELRYEDVTTDPVDSMKRLLDFSELGQDMTVYSERDVHPERDQYCKILLPEEQQVVRNRCGPLATLYGYDLSDRKTGVK